MILIRGGGIYGCVIAETLKQRGHEVVLYERGGDILLGATFKSFRRLHSGFHYPKSMKTARECSSGHDEFIERYSEFVYPRDTRYWIANDSQVLPGEYLEFCDDLGRDYEPVKPQGVNNVLLGISCVEYQYDIVMLREWFKTALTITHDEPREYDLLIDCTYSSSPLAKKCDKKKSTVLHIDARLPPLAQTVLYGPYCGLIPAPEGGFFFFHASRREPRSMISDGCNFFPQLFGARILGTIDATHVWMKSDTGDRPHLIERVDDKTIAVLGGKVAQSVACGEQVCELVEDIGIVPDKGKAAKRRKAP